MRGTLASVTDLEAKALKRTRVAVIYGGRSPEHSISCISAAAIIENLDPARYEVVPIGITRDGVWTSGTADREELSKHGRVMPEVKMREEVSLSFAHPGEFRTANGEVYAQVDVVFPILHGPFGEDGTIQGLFEMAGVPYVGPGVLASAASMDKEFTKKLITAEGLPATREVILREDEEISDEQREYLGLPVFVKPARSGSSVGISKVDQWEDFPTALATARAEDSKVIVEAMVFGIEVEVGVLQFPDGRLLASVPAQLDGIENSPEGFYGFETKYLDDVVTATIPARLNDDTTEQLKKLAIAAFKALNCEGLSRVDFFVTEEGPVLNEVNTMPGFTPISMYPQVMAASGIEYQELLDTLIASALSK